MAITDSAKISPSTTSPLQREEQTESPALDALDNRDASTESMSESRLTDSQQRAKSEQTEVFLRDRARHQEKAPQSKKIAVDKNPVDIPKALNEADAAKKLEAQRTGTKTKPSRWKRWLGKTKVAGAQDGTPSRLKNFKDRVKKFFNFRQKYQDYKVTRARKLELKNIEQQLKEAKTIEDAQKALSRMHALHLEKKDIDRLMSSFKKLVADYNLQLPQPIDD